MRFCNGLDVFRRCNALQLPHYQNVPVNEDKLEQGFERHSLLTAVLTLTQEAHIYDCLL